MTETVSGIRGEAYFLCDRNFLCFGSGFLLPELKIRAEVFLVFLRKSLGSSRNL